MPNARAVGVPLDDLGEAERRVEPHIRLHRDHDAAGVLLGRVGEAAVEPRQGRRQAGPMLGETFLPLSRRLGRAEPRHEVVVGADHVHGRKDGEFATTLKERFPERQEPRWIDFSALLLYGIVNP